MKIIIKFEGSNEVFKKALNKEVNGFINQCLGKDNPYHGNFSRYCISSMQGGRMNKNGELLFKNNAYLQVSTDSDNTEFINRLINGLSDTANGMAIKSLKYKGFEVSVFQPYHKFDIIRTISPLYLTNKDKSLTFKDEDFLKVLRKKSIQKLIYCGVDKTTAETINFKLFHPENAKTRMVKIGKQKNLASQVMLYVEGNRNARLKLYELGLGKCTGFGFGAVMIMSESKRNRVISTDT